MYVDPSDANLIFLATVSGLFGAVIWTTELGQDKRVDILNGVAAEVCKKAVNLDQTVCKDRLARDIQKAEDSDLIDLRNKTKGNMPRLEATIRQTVSDWDRSYGLVNYNVRNVTVNGAKLFADATVETGIESVVRYNNQNTGKFTVVITDPGSTATRKFEFDHATGNVTQTSGSITGTFNIYNYWRTIPGSADLNMTAPVDCKNEEKTACVVVGAVLGALNTMPAGPLESLKSDIEAQDAYSGLGRYVKTLPGYRRAPF